MFEVHGEQAVQVGRHLVNATEDARASSETVLGGRGLWGKVARGHGKVFLGRGRAEQGRYQGVLLHWSYRVGLGSLTELFESAPAI